MPKVIEKGLDLHLYAEPPIGNIPMGDPTRLRQVLINLLSNAVKFTHTGIIKLQVILKESDENSVTLVFDVIDSGIGMSPEQTERIFDTFMQAESGTTRKYGGSGLGLTITKNLVEIMGGKLRVESKPGVGSKFGFQLRFDTKETCTPIMLDKDLFRGELQKPTFEGEILVCEDNVMNQQVVCDHLDRVGLKTVVAENGKIGVDMVKERIQSGQRQFDLIFMDMHMPVMDGLEATAKILDLGTAVPIVAMTANIMSDVREIYMTNGMSGYVGKPFTSQELWRCLMRFFKPLNWQTEQEAQHARMEKGLRQRLINSFVKNNRNKYTEITEAIEDGDIKLAHRLAHTLKSNAGQLDNAGLQKAASDVERSLEDGVNSVGPTQMTVLKSELDAMLAELSPCVEETPQALQGNTLETETTWSIFRKLEPLLDDGDSDCLSYIDDLRRIPGSGNLIRQMEEFDFEKALKALAELKVMYDRRAAR